MRVSATVESTINSIDITAITWKSDGSIDHKRELVSRAGYLVYVCVSSYFSFLNTILLLCPFFFFFTFYHVYWKYIFSNSFYLTLPILIYSNRQR